MIKENIVWHAGQGNADWSENQVHTTTKNTTCSLSVYRNHRCLMHSCESRTSGSFYKWTLYSVVEVWTIRLPPLTHVLRLFQQLFCSYVDLHVVRWWTAKRAIYSCGQSWPWFGKVQNYAMRQDYSMSANIQNILCMYSIHMINIQYKYIFMYFKYVSFPIRRILLEIFVLLLWSILSIL